MCTWCSTFGAEPSKTLVDGWGLSSRMCQACFDKILSKIQDQCKSGTRTFDTNYIEDYAKIYALMYDRPRMNQVLEDMDSKIAGQALGQPGEINWMRFSSILGYYENKCWFHKDVLLPMGILSPDDFYYYIRRGYILKDYGAGVRHGEFTHRLQWHIVMSVITNKFTCPFEARGWSHSPFELYISLGSPANKGMWALLFDLSGEGDYRHPDAFHQDLLNEAPPRVQAFLMKREKKRREEFIQDICRYIKEQIESGNKIDFPDIFLPNQFADPKMSHEDFKKFELWFIKKLREMNPSDEKKVEDIFYKKVPEPSKNLYISNKTRQVESKDNFKYRKDPYVKIARGNVYALTGVTIIDDEKIADGIAGESRKALR
jgi:hypothetical protein